MSTFPTLPWFIVTNIIKQASFKQPFSHQLQLLWICSRWRLLGVPVIFHCAYLSVDKDAPIIKTNIGQVLDNGKEKLVKKLDINVSLNHTSFIPYLVPLLEVFNNGKVAGWPSNYQKLLPKTSNRELMSPKVFLFQLETGPTLPNELLAIVGQCLARFANRFSNIKELDFRMTSKNNLGVQFAGALFRIFSGQVTNLSYMSSVPRHWTLFPTNLTKLEYACSLHHHNTIAAANVRTLESLALLDVPNGFPWYKCFGDVPESQTTLVFPQLKSLHVTYFVKRPDQPAKFYFKKQQLTMTIKMPRLERLRMENIVGSPYTDIILDIPPHLDSVHLDVPIADFIYFSQLPITSIGYLYAAVDFENNHTDREYCAATNWMFGGIANAHSTHVKLYNASRALVPHHQYRFDWPNVEHLEIESICGCTFANTVAYMPNLHSMDIGNLGYIDGTVSQLGSNSTIESVSIRKINAVHATNDDLVYSVMEIIRVLNGLQELYIPSLLVTNVKLKMDSKCVFSQPKILPTTD